MIIGVFALVVLSGWKAETADLELPVPKGWSFDPSVAKPYPLAPAQGRSCRNAIWFDFIPGAALDDAKRLIETESLDVTAAVRRWGDHTYRPMQLTKRPALSMRAGEDRTVYLLAFDHGTLIAQSMAQGAQPADCVPFQDEVAAHLVELFFAPGVQERVKLIGRTQKPPLPKRLAPVPDTLDEALTMLEQKLDAASLAEIRSSKDEQSMIRLHHGLGRGLRNEWGLWSGSPLAKFFEARGVLHPDDMSGIVLTSLWRKVHGAPIGLEEQTGAARRYWELRRPPGQSKPCADGGVPAPLMQLEATDRVVQMFTCGKEYRAWELDAGWYAPGAKLRQRTQALRGQGNIVSAPLDE